MLHWIGLAISVIATLANLKLRQKQVNRDFSLEISSARLPTPSCAGFILLPVGAADDEHYSVQERE